MDSFSNILLCWLYLPIRESLLLLKDTREVIQFFYKNQIILAEPQCSSCSYFVLVTIIIFDLASHICIFIIHAEYSWLVMACLKEKSFTQICVYHILFTDITSDYVAAEDSDGIDLIVKFLLNLCILFIHCSFVCQVSIDLIYFSSLKVFLDPCFQPGHCS